MRFAKHVIGSFAKCYAVAPFDDGARSGFLVGAEKDGPLVRYNARGEAVETLMGGPGGVMTIEQFPGRQDMVLAISEMFSPNCGGDGARVVCCVRGDDGWRSSTVCSLPYVHRFGTLLGPDGTPWLLACTIKGACEHREDWRFPGAVYAACLDEVALSAGEGEVVPEPLREGQLKNHGFWLAPDRSHALVTTDEGVFRYAPPAGEGGAWEVEQLLAGRFSDVAPVDLNGDGAAELVTFSPFHGDTLQVWRRGASGYELAWEDPERHEFIHAIWAGKLAGEPCALVGNRRGRQELLRLFWADGAYATELVDAGCGPANVCVVHDGSCELVVAANRETDELALYEVVP